VVELIALMYALLSTSGEEQVSVEALCRAHPARVESLFEALDLERQGLEAVKAAVDNGTLPAACTALLDYYRQGDTASWLRKPAVKPGTNRVASADTFLAGTFSAYSVSAEVPLREDGGLDWSYNGPNGDREWGWGLNRHPWVSALVDAYHATGNPDYIEGFDRLIRDWVTANPYPGEKNNTPQWRGLEVHSRVAGAWPHAFYGLQHADGFTPAARILMLSSLPDHAHYLRNFHANSGNWIAMELLALAMTAACWPEFKQADAWFDYATSRLVPEITRQVYPDGVQKELTSHYHSVALGSFDRFVQLAKRVGRPLPEEVTSGIERMCNYTAYAMRPTGHGPLNNDSNLDFNRPQTTDRAKQFERPDWAYIATNGAEGARPEGEPSVVFPWAGQVIMRSGWDAAAHWAFFDIGPLGTGHWHFDKLHLSVSAYGRDILVDAGRYTYKGGPWRSYFVGSQSHNVVLVDGCRQKAYAREASEPVLNNTAITPRTDYARGTYDAGFADLQGAATHTRAVVYLRGEYWVVVDRIETDRPRTVQALWHFHPSCTVEADGVSAASTDADKGNVRIVPASDLSWQLDMVNGQTEPEIQGWWSRRYNIKEPSTCAVYTARIDGSATFAWVILPAKGPIPVIEADLDTASPEAAEVCITTEPGNRRLITVPLSGTNVDCP